MIGGFVEKNKDGIPELDIIRRGNVYFKGVEIRNCG